MNDSSSETPAARILEFPGSTPDGEPVDVVQLLTPDTGASGRRAFILEDVEANARLLASYLGQFGFNDIAWVKTVESCYRVMPHLRAGRFDLLLFDIMLDDGVAFDLMQELAGRERDYRVCTFTGRDRPDELTQMREAGCDWVFKKPIDLHSVEAGLEAMGFTASAPDD